MNYYLSLTKDSKVPIYMRIKTLVIAILMGVSPITYSAEEFHDAEKPDNKRNISTVNSNSTGNVRLIKKQKLQHIPLEMSDFPNEICGLFFSFLNGETQVESDFILTCKNWKAIADYIMKKSMLKSKFIHGKASVSTAAPLIYSMAICLRYWGYP